MDIQQIGTSASASFKACRCAANISKNKAGDRIMMLQIRDGLRSFRQNANAGSVFLFQVNDRPFDIPARDEQCLFDLLI
jgi:hypothetical protein